MPLVVDWTLLERRRDKWRALMDDVEEWMADVPPDALALTMAWRGERRSGVGRAAMGSPAKAVAYLVRELAQRGARLEAEMVVLTGGITAPIDLEPGLEIEVSSPQLGSCSLRCT